jgi:trk system potassium uptake protein TrkA
MPKFTGALTKYPARASCAWYVGLIAVGALVLTLPICRQSGKSPVTVLDAVFTATSAACVTGLAVRSTGHDFSPLGQLAILALIQLGGIGIMTVTTLVTFRLGGRESLRHRAVLAETLGANAEPDLRWVLRSVMLTTFAIEGVGFVLLAVRNLFDQPLGEALWHALFHYSSRCPAKSADIRSNIRRRNQSSVSIMAYAKRFVVLGLGTFGRALAEKLAENGCRVTGVDRSRGPVEDLKDVLYESVIADVTERESLEHLSLPDADAVLISLGGNISFSLLATLHAKELGAKRIIVKGATPEHGKLLMHLGVERVVFPEQEIARELADRMTWPNVLDFVPIDPNYSLVEMAAPESCAGQTLKEADLRHRFNVWVLGVKDALSGKLTIFPDADFKLSDDQLLLAIGKQEDLNRLRELK